MIIVRRLWRLSSALIAVSIFAMASVAPVTHAQEIVVDLSELNAPKNVENVEIGHFVSHLRYLGYPVCAEYKTLGTPQNVKVGKQNLRIEAASIKEALDVFCEMLPDYAWESTEEGQYVISPRSSPLLDIEVALTNDVSGSAGQLIRSYLTPHGLHLSHFRRPHSEADDLQAHIPKGRYTIKALLSLSLKNSPDLLWDISGASSYRMLSVSRLSGYVSYWQNVKPQENARKAKQDLQAGKMSLGKTVEFADSALNRVILEALGKQSGPIFEAELATIFELDASAKGIEDLAGLGRLPNLIWLNLATNKIGNLAPLGECKKLLKLGLSSNEISDITPLGALGRMSILHLTRNQVSDVGPLGKLRSLKRLGLSHNQIVDIAPLVKNAEQGGLGKGSIVWLQFNPIAKESVDRDLPRLRELGVDVHFELGAGFDPHTGRSLPGAATNIDADLDDFRDSEDTDKNGAPPESNALVSAQQAAPESMPEASSASRTAALAQVPEVRQGTDANNGPARLHIVLGFVGAATAGTVGMWLLLRRRAG